MKVLGVEIGTDGVTMIPVGEESVEYMICCDCHLRHAIVYSTVKVGGKLHVKLHWLRDDLGTNLMRKYERDQKVKQRREAKKRRRNSR